MTGARCGAGVAVVLTGAALAVAGPVGPAAAAGPVTTVQALRLTQTEVMCGGAEVPVTFTGEMRTTELVDGAGRTAGWSRFHAELSWAQDEVQYTARATGGFATGPGQRVSRYHVHAAGSGSDGSRVHVMEVVVARATSAGDLEVLFEVERVTCR